MAARGKIAFVLVLTAFLAVGAAWAGTSRSATRTLYVDGDSLAVGTAWYLSTYLPGWTLRGTVAVSRHAYQGAFAVEERARESLLERVVVVDLGTNDDPSAVSRFQASVREVVRAAGPSRCVIWATINRPPYNGISYSGYNDVLTALDAKYRNLRLFDWAGMARAHRDWFGPDGVHPTNTGYRSRAAALARLIKRC